MPHVKLVMVNHGSWNFIVVLLCDLVPLSELDLIRHVPGFLVPFPRFGFYCHFGHELLLLRDDSSASASASSCASTMAVNGNRNSKSDSNSNSNSGNNNVSTPKHKKTNPHQQASFSTVWCEPHGQWITALWEHIAAAGMKNSISGLPGFVGYHRMASYIDELGKINTPTAVRVPWAAESRGI